MLFDRDGRQPDSLLPVRLEDKAPVVRLGGKFQKQKRVLSRCKDSHRATANEVRGSAQSDRSSDAFRLP